MASSSSINFDRLWQHLTSNFQGHAISVHGPSHWRRVERNGLLLASRTSANTHVVRLFAVLHDSCRTNDGHDRDHGARAAKYAATLRGVYFNLPDDDFALLEYACTWHTDVMHHQHPTIGTCWDADRLDLGRVGIVPSPKFMSTKFGKEIAEAGSIEPFLKTQARQ